MKNKITIKKSSVLLGIFILSILFSLISINAAEQSLPGSSDIDKLITYFNSTGGGIPITVTTTAATDWTQYITTMLLSSFFIFFFFGSMLIEVVKTASTKLYFTMLKRKTGRHIIFIKHTSQDLFSSSMIDQSTVNKIAEAMNEFKGKPFDLILHTPGGEVFSAMFISRMLKQYPGHIRTVIPLYAMSGGTLLALSTDELVMAQTACLGPVDPQLGTLFKYGSAKSWDFIKKFKGKRAEDSSLSLALTGEQYTKSIRTHLENTIDFGLTPQQKKVFASFLTSGDVEHAFPLTPMELSKFGLNIRMAKNEKFITKMIDFISKTGKEGVTYV